MIYWFRTESGFASRAQFMLNKHEIPIHVFAIICNLTFFFGKFLMLCSRFSFSFLPFPMHAAWIIARTGNSFTFETIFWYVPEPLMIAQWLILCLIYFFFCKQNDDKVRNQLQSDAKIAHNHWIQLPRPIITHSESGYIKKRSKLRDQICEA